MNLANHLLFCATGQSSDHVITSIAFAPFKLLPRAETALVALRRDAQQAGLDLAIVSSFRNFEKQKQIWNGKALGQRALLDDDGHHLNFSELSPRELLLSILRWSALPGASRHHWGCDVDVIDPSAIDQDFKIQLIPAECADGGPFCQLHQWLDEKIEKNEAYGFYRPYAHDRGGVAPEPWHLGHGPSGREFAAAWTRENLRAFYQQRTDLVLHAEILRYFDEIFDRFISCPLGPESSAD